jgi:hypothetical protein
MSLEQKIDNLVTVIEKLVTVIEAAGSKGVAQPEPVVCKKEPEPVAEPVVAVQTPQPAPAPAPVVEQPAPVVVPVAAPVAPVMPALPTFELPVVPPAPACPFNDFKGMVGYVTEVYRTLGSRGAEMQAEILAMGHQHINDVPASDYPELYRRMEKLKNGA